MKVSRFSCQFLRRQFHVYQGSNSRSSGLSAASSFNKEFANYQIKTSDFQRVLLGVGSAIASLVDPSRQEMIACLGETTGELALQEQLKIMKTKEEGLEILDDRPRINSQTIDFEKLKYMDKESFGHVYWIFLRDNQVTPDSRLEVRFMDDPDLAYVMTRYRECHDLVHAVLGMPTNMLGEVAVKWVEALNMNLPMCWGAAVFGAARLKPKQRVKYTNYYLPWALKNGQSAKPLLNVYWEKRFEQNVHELRKELNLEMLVIP